MAKPLISKKLSSNASSLLTLAAGSLLTILRMSGSGEILVIRAPFSAKCFAKSISTGRRRPYVNEALSITRKLVAEHPDNKIFLIDLPTRLNHLGDLYLETGKKEDALSANREATEVRRRICEQDPANKEMKQWLSYDLYCESTALSALNRPDEAEKCARESIAIANDLIRADPVNLARLQFLALYELALANALRDEKRIKEAKEAYQTCLHSVSLYVEKGGLPQSVHYPRGEAEKALATLK